MNYILVCVLGISSGAVISAGVFALITSTGLMPRLAGVTHTGKYVRTYEDAVVLGGSICNFIYVFLREIQVLQKVLILGYGVFGIAAGAYVGCLAVSLAEALKSTAIFSRRVKLCKGMSFIVVSVAVGKLLGAIWQLL